MHVAAGLMTGHLTEDLIPTLRTLGLLMGRGLLLGMMVYSIYMALEPDVRRRWPETLIAWSRVLAGRVNDPLVGRDLLLGILADCRGAPPVLFQLSQRAPAWVGSAPGVSVPFQGFDGSLVSAPLIGLERQRGGRVDSHDVSAGVPPAVCRSCDAGSLQSAHSACCSSC